MICWSCRSLTVTLFIEITHKDPYFMFLKGLKRRLLRISPVALTITISQFFSGFIRSHSLRNRCSKRFPLPTLDPDFVSLRLNEVKRTPLYCRQRMHQSIRSRKTFHFAGQHTHELVVFCLTLVFHKEPSLFESPSFSPKKTVCNWWTIRQNGAEKLLLGYIYRTYEQM